MRITSVELVDTPRQLQLVGALIGAERTENHQMEPRFPPTHSSLRPLVPAEGAVLQPEKVQEAEGTALTGYVLVLGLEATVPGRWVRGGYRVSYEVDGRPYELEVVAQITVCTDDYLEPDGTCPMEQRPDEQHLHEERPAAGQCAQSGSSASYPMSQLRPYRSTTCPSVAPHGRA